MKFSSLFFLVTLVVTIVLSCSIADIDSFSRISGDAENRSGLGSNAMLSLPNGITLQRIDSLYYWDDMVFNESGLDYLCPGYHRSAYRDEPDFYWPYCTVYYKYNSNVTDTTYFRYAMNHISANSSIVFKLKTSSTPNYIEFKASTSGNDSYVGMQSGAQVINITSMSSMKVIVHEIMHSLGFFHEHCRTDRDSYITINWDNIKLTKRYNFNKFNQEYSGVNQGNFDFSSIMLYDSHIYDPNFVYDTTIPAMQKLDGSPFYQGSILSSGDVAGLTAIYGPPFHRLESHFLGVIQDYYTNTEDVYITEHADSIIFYADKSCTVRQALQYPRKIRIDMRNEGGQGFDYNTTHTYYTVTIPAGVSAYQLWHGYDYQCYYYGNPYNFMITSLSIISAHVNGIWL